VPVTPTSSFKAKHAERLPGVVGDGVSACKVGYAEEGQAAAAAAAAEEWMPAAAAAAAAAAGVARLQSSQGYARISEQSADTVAGIAERADVETTRNAAALVLNAQRTASVVSSRLDCALGDETRGAVGTAFPASGFMKVFTYFRVQGVELRV
jgi:hypothetical protein